MHAYVLANVHTFIFERSNEQHVFAPNKVINVEEYSLLTLIINPTL